jgi:PAS domain S-box-containing protein
VTIQTTAYALLLLLSGVVSGGLSVYAVVRHRTATRNRESLWYFAVLMSSAGAWSVIHAIGITVVAFETKVLLLVASNVATVVVPTAWLTFALSYTDNGDYVTRRTLAALAVEPVVVLVGLATTLTHGHSLYFADLGLTNDPGFWVLSRETGLLFVLHAGYSYALVVTGALVVLQFVRLGEQTYRGQAAALVGGSLLPVVTNVVFVLDVVDLQVNLTPVVLGISGLAFAVAINRYGFLDLAPVARDTAVERMREAYVVCDTDGTIVDSNRAAARFLGADGQLVGTHIRDVLPEVEEAVAHGTDSAQFRGAVTRPVDGELRYFDANTSTLDAVDGTLVVLRDITDKRQAERRFQTLIERSSDIITVLDADGVVDYISPTVERSLGLASDAIAGEVVFDLVHPDDRDALRAVFDDAVEQAGAVERVEYRLADADGNWHVHEAVGRNFLDDPSVQGIVVNARDVTERKERERELEATMSDLERANERLERFASVVSHDLRNPLNVADGYADLLDERVDDPAVDEIRESHERMRHIIDDVLELASDSAGVDDRTESSLATVARDAWRNVDTAGATLDATDGVVVADRSLLVRAFENCFRNAVEHGGSDVHVRVAPLDDGFSITDDGPGVPEDVRGSLFDEGVSGDGSTGLGLAIVADIVDAHGWTIDAVDDGTGARFEVRAGEAPVSADTE